MRLVISDLIDGVGTRYRSEHTHVLPLLGHQKLKKERVTAFAPGLFDNRAMASIT